MKKKSLSLKVRLLQIILPALIMLLSSNVFGQTIYYSNNFEDGNMSAEIGTSQIELLGTNSQCVVVNNPNPSGFNTSSKVFKSMAGVGEIATANRGRAELSSQRIPTMEKVHTYEFQVYFPADYFTGITYEFQYTSQFKTYPCEKASGYNICPEGGGIFNDITFNPNQYNFRYRANPSCYTATPSLELGVWTDFRMEIYWTKTMNGWVKLYKNDVLVYTQSNINTLFSDWSETGSCDIYWAIGQYTRWNPNGTGRQHRVAYYDNISVKEGAGPPPPPTCGVPVNWSNSAFAAQTGSFTTEFDVAASGPNMDGVVGLSNGVASSFTNLACAIQFATDGTIKARNGSAFAAATAVNYAAGTSYRIRMEVDVTNKTYSVYVTPAGGTQQTLGIGYAFRTEQNTVSQLNNIAINTLSCSLAVSNFTVVAATAPAAPTGLSATKGNAQVSLSWTASAGATSYTVKRSITSGSGYTNVATGITGTSYSNTGLTNGTIYYYVVSATNPAGTSGNSSQVSVTPTNVLIDESFVSSAANFTVARGGIWTVTGGKYVLTSAATTGVGNGNISVHNTSVSGVYTLSADASATSNTSSPWDDFSILFNYQDANNYYYVSLNESNDASTSGIFKIAGGVITQLADITTLLTAGTTYAVKIVRDGSAITVSRNGVQIATATDATFTSGKVGFGTLNNGASFDNLVVSTGTTGPLGSLASLNTGSNLLSLDGLSNPKTKDLSSNLSVYPNPTTGKFSIEISDNDMANGQLTVTDVLGRVVIKNKQLDGNKLIDIDIAKEPRGIYLIVIVKDDKLIQSKLLKE